MPEAPMNKNYCTEFRKSDIGFSGKVLAVQAEPVAEAMKNAPNTDLGPRVRAAYRSHVAAALFL
jgi:hypothetical protein